MDAKYVPQGAQHRFVTQALHVHPEDTLTGEQRAQFFDALERCLFNVSLIELNDTNHWRNACLGQDQSARACTDRRMAFFEESYGDDLNGACRLTERRETHAR